MVANVGSSSIFGPSAESMLLHHRTFAMHKPRGVLSISGNVAGQRTLSDLFDQCSGHIGRLDVQTSGLLLLTEDSSLLRAVLGHGNMQKTYSLLLGGSPTQNALTSLGAPLSFSRAGRTVHAEAARVQDIRIFDDWQLAANFEDIDRDDINHISPAVRRVVPESSRLTEVELQISQGRHHQIRRLCHRAGVDLLHLRRTAIGPIALGSMCPGEVRELSADEKWQLYTALLSRVQQGHARKAAAAQARKGRERRKQLRARWREDTSGESPQIVTPEGQTRHK